MSFRETRNLIEMLKSLGYTKPISLMSFRQPNFNLVADILHWLVESYDPMSEVSLEIETEQDRVHFIKTVATAMAAKGHLKLNTKRLYGADGYCVKELLKVASLLYEANQSLDRALDLEDAPMVSLSYDIADKLSDLKSARSLTSEMTHQGAGLYDLLEKELELRDQRLGAIAKQLDMKVIESQLEKQVQGVREQIMAVQQATDNLSSDEQNLQSKIDKKKQELDRLEKRLKSLEGVRPAFMDEFERLEQEVRKLYVVYVDKFRSVTYLEHQLDDIHRKEHEQAKKYENALKEIQSNVRAKERRHLKEQDQDDLDMSGDLNGSLPSKFSSSSLPITPESMSIRQSATVSRTASNSLVASSQTSMPKTPQQAAGNKPKIMGNMMGGDEDEEPVLRNGSPPQRGIGTGSSGRRMSAALNAVPRKSELSDSDSDFGADEAENLMGPDANLGDNADDDF